MARKYLILLFGFVVCVTAEAQENQFKRTNSKSQRYWLLGIGISAQSMYDEAISHVRYQNSGLGIRLALIKTNEKKYSEFAVDPTFVKLKTKLSNGLRPMAVATTRIAASYQHLKRVKLNSKNAKLFVGGAVPFLFNFKSAPQLDNSEVVYDYSLSIAAAGRIERQFYWRKRNCVFSYNLSVPLVSHIARPYYLNRIEFIDPKNDFLGDLLKNSSIVTFNKYIRLTSGFSITYPLFNSNALRLGYQWDFYKMKTINKVYAAEHLIYLAFMPNY